ncbi:MAG TPA: hypothetical protein VNO50_19195 [Pyrinomonadaceae bacterium]|nr:hypothetical protein [Pyrinomonadaceae bacterium]
MSKQTRRKRLTILLALVMITLCLLPGTPASRLEANTYSCEQYAYCIEYTVFNEYACRCECPNQECCEFYYPFIPYGCPGNPRSKGKEETKKQIAVPSYSKDLGLKR